MNTVNSAMIQEWLVQTLAKDLGFEVEEIDTTRPFAEYGLDSIAAVTMAGDLEDWLGLELPPTLLWDYPEIETLAQYLAEGIAAKPSTPGDTQQVSRGTASDIVVGLEHISQSMANLDKLSDDDVDTLLDRLLAA